MEPNFDNSDGAHDDGVAEFEAKAPPPFLNFGAGALLPPHQNDRDFLAPLLMRSGWAARWWRDDVFFRFFGVAEAVAAEVAPHDALQRRCGNCENRNAAELALNLHRDPGHVHPDRIGGGLRQRPWSKRWDKSAPIRALGAAGAAPAELKDKARHRQFGRATAPMALRRVKIAPTSAGTLMTLCSFMAPLSWRDMRASLSFRRTHAADLRPRWPRRTF